MRRGKARQLADQHALHPHQLRAIGDAEENGRRGGRRSKLDKGEEALQGSGSLAASELATDAVVCD
jgi:hypothetical protein